jgi:hypothetical protein
MATVVDVRNHLVPVEGLLMRVSKLLQFPVQVVQCRGQCLSAQL